MHYYTLGTPVALVALQHPWQSLWMFSRTPVRNQMFNISFCWWKVAALVIVELIPKMVRCSQNSAGMTEGSGGYSSARYHCLLFMWSQSAVDDMKWINVTLFPVGVHHPDDPTFCHIFLCGSFHFLVSVCAKTFIRHCFFFKALLTNMSCVSFSKPVKDYIQSNPGWYWAS